MAAFGSEYEELLHVALLNSLLIVHKIKMLSAATHRRELEIGGRWIDLFAEVI